MPTVLVVLNSIWAVGSPWQTTWLAGWFTCPTGFTVMLNCLVGPTQVLPPLVKYGVTVMVAVMGELPAFDAVNAGIEPLPETPSPIEDWLFVQV